MEFSFALLLLLLDVPHLRGQVTVEEFSHVVLRFTFPSYYNNYYKSCCMLYPGVCYTVMDNRGNTSPYLSGRVTKMESDGWIEFRISNVQLRDRGLYRCSTGSPSIYMDYAIEVYEAPHLQTQPRPPLTTTTQAPSTSTAPPGSTRALLAGDLSESPSMSWTLVLTLAVSASVIVTAAVVAVTSYRVKAKHKQSDTCGDTECESEKQEAPELSNVVYTTVDFRAHQRLSEVYANLRTNRTQASDLTEQDGMVEYSTLAVHKG